MGIGRRAGGGEGVVVRVFTRSHVTWRPRYSDCVCARGRLDIIFVNISKVGY